MIDSWMIIIGSVFTYGQTSSGKTFTMTGNNSQPGIIPQAIHHCFDSIHSFSDREFLVRVSYLEIYNEQVKDLLNSEVVAIKIQHDPKNGTVISGVKEQVVVNSEQTISLIKAGEAHRHVGATDMNEKSSRAHTLFKLTIESRERTGSSVPSSSNGYSPVRVSSLNLVDLAGSENAKQTNSKGDRALEARYINQSLLTLSTIIHKLSEEKPGMTPLTRRQHLPYRDSKLTRILQPSLDGNAQIAVICTISPVQSCVEETNNTLKFATRAKSVKMNAKVNDVMDEKTLLKVYREEIEQLKAKLFELEMQSKLYNESPVLRRQALHDNDDDDEQETLLQMITEMESMILKADTKRFQGTLSGSSSGMSTPIEGTILARANSFRSKATPTASASNQGIAMPEANPEIINASHKSNASTVSKISTTSKMTTDSLPNKLPKSSTKVADKRPSNVVSTPIDKRPPMPGEDAKKSKSRFGFGFGFKQKSTTEKSTPAIASPVPSQPTGTSTPDREAEKTRKKSVGFDNTNSHEGKLDYIETSDAEAEDYNSVDEQDRNSMLERQSSIVNRVQSFRGDDVGDKVLFGVSKMLAALKLHIGKSRGQSNAPPIRKSSSDDTGRFLYD
jgi:centromeric protein E